MCRKDFRMRLPRPIALCRSRPLLFNRQVLMDQERLADLGIWPLQSSSVRVCRYVGIHPVWIVWKTNL